MMLCPACEHENPPQSLFCNRCAAPQATGGGAPSPPNLAGAGVVADRSTRSERRQLTLVFCDLVGSARMAERVDPEELRELLGSYHAICAAASAPYDGYVAQYLGDGVLIYFGYPRAHEDDADRAVRAALEIQRRLGEGIGAAGRVRARIGIHTGLVVVGEIGNEARHETLALGSPTNIAARIHGLAEEGGVAISEATYRLTAGVFVRDLGLCKLKGLDETLRIYAVDRAFGGGRRGGVPEAPLFGRDEELGRLRESFESARQGRGRVVLIEGEPGIGKSRLARALRHDAPARPRLWVNINCSPYTTGNALGPVVALVEAWFAFGGELAPEKRTQLAVKALAQVAGLALERVAPYLLALLGLPPHAEFPLPVITPEQQRERTMLALVAVIEAVAKERTLVLEVEDLHWADPSTLQYLARLGELAPRTRLLLLCTAREAFGQPWQGEHVALTRLPAWPTLELIEAVAGGRSLSTGLLRRISDRSDGVPLFIEQLTLAVLESELAPGPGEPAHLRAIPATLVGLLTARLDRLGSAKRVAQLAATLGREFTYELLEKLGELPVHALRSGFSRLIETDLISSVGTPANVTYRFKHTLLRETAYQSLLHSDRRAVHARVAAALEQHFPALVAAEPGVLARHCAEARLYDQAASHYAAAGALASARYANHEATASLRLALGALAELPETRARRERELSVCLALAPPLIVSLNLDHPEVGALHERIAALSDAAGAGVAQLPALLYLSRYYQRCGAVDQAARLGESILRIAREAGIPLMEAVGRLILGTCEITRSHAAVAIEHLERALEIAASIELPPSTSALEPDLLAFVHATLGLALAVGGRFDEAGAQLLAARARAFKGGHEPTCILVLALSTIALSLMTAYETTLEWGREALALAEGRGFHTSEAQAHAMLGRARVALGEPAGLAEAEAGLAQAIEVGFRGGLCHYIEAAAEANQLAGRYERAHQLLDLAQKTYEATGEATFAGRVHRRRGMIYLGQRNHEMAEAELRAALGPLEAVGARVEQLLVATELLRLALGREDEAAARARVQDAYDRCAGGHQYRPQRAAKALLDETAAWILRSAHAS